MFEYDDFSEHESESATWISLADLMTGLMAIFLVLFMIKITQEDRTRIVLIQTIKQELKKANIEVTTDAKTGDVSIKNDQLKFAQDSSILTSEGKLFLNTFVPAYTAAVFSDSKELSRDVRLDQVIRLNVEGRTSSEGTAQRNIALSLERANAVVQYIYAMPEFAYKEDLIKRLTPVGRGANENGSNVANPADREVLFRFQFKSELPERQSTSTQATTEATKGQFLGNP